MLSFIQRYALAGALILAGGLGLGLAYTKYELSNAKEVIQGLVEWQDGIVDTTRLAAGSPDVTKQTANAQIQALGQLRIELKNAIGVQNDAILQLEKESAAARALVAKVTKQKEAAIQRADDLQRKLKDRAGTPAKDTDAAVRQTQDELYEAGL